VTREILGANGGGVMNDARRRYLFCYQQNLRNPSRKLINKASHRECITSN